MAQVLHDHLQQLLVAARFKLVTLSRRIPDKALGPVATQASELLEQCIAESRSLTMELSPPVLYDAGLVAGLHWLARWMHQKHDLIVTVQADDEAELADEGIRVFLFQAVRELLFNVAKHAQANEAQVRMTKTPDEAIRIEVCDFGTGFDPARLQPQAVSPEGFGLFSIRERVEFLGGLLQLDSSPGQGTRAIISVPIRQAPPVAASRQAADGQRPTDMAIPSASPDIPGPTVESTNRIRVLLVDDHPILRRGLADLFDERPEIDLVAEASDGQEAVETALRPSA